VREKDAQEAEAFKTMNPNNHMERAGIFKNSTQIHVYHCRGKVICVDVDPLLKLRNMGFGNDIVRGKAYNSMTVQVDMKETIKRNYTRSEIYSWFVFLDAEGLEIVAHRLRMGKSPVDRYCVLGGAKDAFSANEMDYGWPEPNYSLREVLPEAYITSVPAPRPLIFQALPPFYFYQH
jgi:hypothetical protein